MEFLKRIWKAWKAFAHALGKVQTMVLLTVFYFLILGPASLFFRLLGKPALTYRGKDPDTFWINKPANARGEAQYYQQF